MHLHPLEPLGAIAKVDGLALSVLQAAGGRVGWVLTAGYEVVTWDGWYDNRGDRLKPLAEALNDPDDDGVEAARMLNQRQLGRAMAAAGHPLVESGLDKMPERAGDDHPMGWGATSLERNEAVQSASIVAVAALGSAETLSELAQRVRDSG